MQLLYYNAFLAVSLLLCCGGTHSRNDAIEESTIIPSTSTKLFGFVTFIGSRNDPANNETNSYLNLTNGQSPETEALLTADLADGSGPLGFAFSAYEDVDGDNLNDTHANKSFRRGDISYDDDQQDLPEENDHDVEKRGGDFHEISDRGDSIDEQLNEQGPTNYDEYDYDNGQSTFGSYYEFVYIAMAIIGTITNALVTLTWSKVENFNITAFLLTFLGVSDFLFVFVMIFLQAMITGIETFSYGLEWTFYIIVYLSFIAQFMSIFTTALVSVTRYLAVKYPFKFKIWFTKYTAKILLAVIVVSSIIFAYPASSVACLFLYIKSPGDYDYGSSDGGATFDIDTNSSKDLVKEGRGSDGSLGLTSVTNHLLNFTADTWTSNSTQSPLGTTDSLSINEELPQPFDGIETCFLSPSYDRAFMMISAAITNIIPWIVVIPMNFLLINQVRSSLKNRKLMTSKEELSSRTMDAVVIILTIQSIVAYPLFFLLEILTNKLDWDYFFGGEPAIPIPEMSSVHITSWRDAFHVLNSSLNIVAYCACGRRFRKIMLEEVLKCGLTKTESTSGSSDRQIEGTKSGRRSDSHETSTSKAAPKGTQPSRMPM